jgi:hypothetical protein
MNHSSGGIARLTSRVIDITGPENTLILLAAPGDEVSVCGGLIAEACARGRPPFVAILGDGAEDGSASLARGRELASRTACRILGLPDDLLLFVGLRQGRFPAAGTPLFGALRAAITEVSWRRDCNVILAPFAAVETGGDSAWPLAGAVARDIGLPLLAAEPAGPEFSDCWRLDARQWDGRVAAAGQVHGDQRRGCGFEEYGRAA